MPRILGVDIPNDKRTVISLQYIYGIGPFLAELLCERTGIDPDKRARDLTEDDLAKLASLLDNEFTVEGQLRRQIQQNIARLRDIGCYRGLRHRKGLPVRGQRTRTNARTRKGPARRSPARRASRNCESHQARCRRSSSHRAAAVELSRHSMAGCIPDPVVVTSLPAARTGIIAGVLARRARQTEGPDGSRTLVV